MTTLKQYLVPCVTEGANVFTDFRDTIPTVCPNNNTHIIDPDGILAVGIIHPKVVTINQNSSSVSCGGYYRVDQFEFSVPGGTGASGSYDITYPYNIAAYSATFFTNESNVGDSFNIVAYPNTLVGTLDITLNPGDTTLTTQNVFLLNPGFNLYVTDGVNTDNLGSIVSLNVTGGTVTFSTPAVNTYGAGSTVLSDMFMLKNGKFVNDRNMSLGFSKIGSIGLEANKIVRVNYVNSTGNTKTINFILEIQY